MFLIFLCPRYDVLVSVSDTTPGLPSRSFIREGPAVVNGKQRYLFVFSDVIVATVPHKKQPKRSVSECDEDRLGNAWEGKGKSSKSVKIGLSVRSSTLRSSSGGREPQLYKFKTEIPLRNTSVLASTSSKGNGFLPLFYDIQQVWLKFSFL